jgi:hypothetical protein
VDTIRDMLSVGQERNGDWAIYRWDVWPAPRTVATFPREDEAWGVTSLVLEYAEKHLYDPQAAIWAALDEYHRACADSALQALDNAPVPTDLAYQDHARAMGYVC